MQTTFSKRNQKNGSNRVYWNVERGAVPFGQVWTFKGNGETHPYHAKTLNDEYDTFDTLEAAKTFMVNARDLEAFTVVA